MKNFLLTLLMLSLTHLVNANELELAPGEVNCNNTLKLCQYIARNVDAGTFVSKITKIMFPPGTFLNPEDGYFHADGQDKIVFWFKGGQDSDTHNRFVGLIPVIDSFDSFDLPAYVQVSIEIFSITDTGLSDLSVETSRYVEEVDGKTEGVLDLAVNVGSMLLKTVFATQKTKKQIERLTRVTQIIPNMRTINFAHTTKLYVSPNSMTTKEESPGVKLYAQASINKDNRDVVELRGFGLTYGVQNNMDGAQPTVTTLEFNMPEIQLSKNRSIVLVSSQTIELSRNSSLNTSNDSIGVGGGKNSSQSKLLLVTSARALSFKELEEESRGNEIDFRKIFSAEEIASLPNQTVTYNELINSLDPYTIITATNDRYLMLRLDKKLASKENFKKNVTVKIRGGGIKQEDTLTIEELMLKGLRLNDLSPEYLNKNLVDLTVKIGEHSSDARGPFGSHDSNWITKKFEYSPKRNIFIK